MMARSSAAEALREAVEAQELLTVVDTTVDGADNAAHSALPFEKARELECLGLRWKGNTLIVGAPEERWFEVEDFADSLGIKIELVATTSAEIREALSLTATLQKVEKTSLDVSRIEVGEAPISNLIQQLIERSVLERASDLHFETYAEHVVVRARVDGRLRDLVQLPGRLAPAISSRIKVLAQMNIVERRRPQDGQFSTSVGDRQVDIRASSVATVHGEKIVLRLHDARKPSVDLGSLGMGEDQLHTFNQMINANNGLILVAGPTGSGKTTTLHSALQAVATAEKNVITIEDPVEYVVPGINQIPVLDGANSGFAVQLRAVLRQDPDIILVGETRDAETARISVQAALTGHLVFTSIHATDSVGALYRLLQMDIESHLIASAIRGVVSQRLIRKNCLFCSESYKPTANEVTTLEHYGFKAKTLVRGVGCTMCGGSGYRDRIAAYQMLNITEELAELVVTHPEPNEFRRKALVSGMTTMDHEGVRLAVEGISTLDEALTLMVNNND
jgi:type IV pilus assembly protein PilB